MKISELVEALERVRKENGDLKVVVKDNEFDDLHCPCVSLAGDDYGHLQVVFEIAAKDYLP